MLTFQPVFRGPHDDDDDADHHEHSVSAPLLHDSQRDDGPTLEDELEALGDGPAAARGTMMDGIANMANSILGAGIIGLPYAIRQAGFVTGIALLVGLAIVTDWYVWDRYRC